MQMDDISLLHSSFRLQFDEICMNAFRGSVRRTFVLCWVMHQSSFGETVLKSLSGEIGEYVSTVCFL